MVAEKPDLTFDRFRFCCNFQTVRNLQKGTTKFRGSKNGGKELWVGLKWSENTKIRRPKFAAAAAFAGPIRAGPVEKFYRRGHLVILLLHLWRVYNSDGWNRLPRLKPDRPKNGSKRPSSGFSGFFFRIFSRVLGLDPHLAPKTRLI